MEALVRDVTAGLAQRGVQAVAMVDRLYVASSSPVSTPPGPQRRDPQLLHRVALGGTRPEASRSDDNARSGLAGDRGPRVHAELCGLMMDVEHAPPPAAALYERVTHLSAP